MATRTPFDHWLVLYRRRLIVLLTVASAVTTAWMVSEQLTPVYEAHTEFYLTETIPNTSFFAKLAAPAGVSPSELVIPVITKERERSYLGILKSSAIQLRVVEQVPAKPLGRLSKDVNFQARQDHTLHVRVRDHDPKIAARVAAAYPKSLNSFLQDAAERRLKVEVKAKRDVLDQTFTALQRARENLREFWIAAGTPDVQREIAERMSRRATLEAELGKARVSLESAKSRVAALEDQLRREAAVFGFSQAIVGTDIARKLQGEISDIQSELAAARIRYTERHPALLALRGRLAEKQRDLERQVEQLSTSEIKTVDSFHEQLRRQLVGAIVEYATLDAEVIGKSRALREQSNRLAGLPASRVSDEEYRAKVERLERMLEALAVSHEESRAQLLARHDQVVVVGEAEIPDAPSYPIAWFNATIGGFLGLIGGLYLAFFFDYVVETRARRGP